MLLIVTLIGLAVLFADDDELTRCPVVELR